MAKLRGRRPILIALAAQFGAAAAALVAVQAYLALSGQSLPLWITLLVASGAAAGLGWVLGARGAWLLLQPAFPLLLVGALQLELPVWVPASAVLLLALLLGNSLTDRVPLYLSNRAVLDALKAEVPAEEPVRVVDLGSGLGAVPRALAAHNGHPDSVFDGVESAPLVWLISRLFGIGGDPRVRLRFGSLWECRLRDYDVVYAFLSPHPMPALYDKARREMTAGSDLISNSFGVPDHPPDRRVELGRGRSEALLIWRMPGAPSARE